MSASKDLWSAEIQAVNISDSICLDMFRLVGHIDRLRLSALQGDYQEDPEVVATHLHTLSGIMKNLRLLTDVVGDLITEDPPVE